MLGEVSLNCSGFQCVNTTSRPLAVNIVVHFLGGFQATFLIRNHSNVHCVEVGSKAALKDDETFDVYHLDKCTMFRNHSNVHCVEVDLKAALS